MVRIANHPDMTLAVDHGTVRCETLVCEALVTADSYTLNFEELVWIFLRSEKIEQLCSYYAVKHWNIC